MVALVSGNGLGLLNSSATVLGQQFGTASTGKKNEAAFINVANGNLSLQDHDDFLSSIGGFNVDLARTYNSQGTFDDGNGHNWKLGLAKRVSNLTGQANSVGSTVTRIDGDGSASVYTYDASRAAYVSTDGAGGYKSLYYNSASSEWTWTDERKDQVGSREIYDASGRIVSIKFGDLTFQNFTYNARGQLAQINDSSLDVTTLKYNANTNLLSEIQTRLRDGTDLTRVRYTYDTLGRMETCVTDLTPADSTDNKIYTTLYTYDGNSDRIESVLQDDGSKISFHYSQINGSWKVDNFTDAKGRITRLDYSVAGETTVTDPLLNKTTYKYDAKGQLLEVRQPMVNGFAPTTQYSYDPSGNGDLRRVTVKSGPSTSLDTIYEYDANGNRKLERDAAGNTITRTFDSNNNRMLTETRYAIADPDGDGTAKAGAPMTSRYVYDGLNRLRFEISAEGRVTEYGYDKLSELAQVYKYNVNLYNLTGLSVTAIPSLADMTTWRNAAAIDLQQITLTEYVYGVRHSIVAMNHYTSVNAAREGVLSTQTKEKFFYDQAGVLQKKIDGNGNATSYAYDGLGRLLATTDANTNTTSTSYLDLPSGETVTSIKPDNTSVISSFDVMGNLIKQETRLSNVVQSSTSFVYDAMQRLRMTENAVGQRQYFLYDAAGRKTAEIDRDGSLTEYFYNNLGQVSKVTQYATRVNPSSLMDSNNQPREVAIASLRPNASSDDRSLWKIYDKAGRLFESVDGNGSLTRFEYDGASRLLKQTELETPVNLAQFSGPDLPTSIVSQSAPKDRITRWFYDQDGKQTFKLDADGFLSKNEYNAGGKLIANVAYANTVASEKRVDALATVISDFVHAPSKDVWQRFIYNSKDQLVGKLDGENYLTEMVYDDAGNLASQRRYAAQVSNPSANSLALVGRKINDALDQVTRFSYTALNQLKEQIDPELRFTRYTYDKLGQVIQIDKGSNAVVEASTAKRYDAMGNVVAELSEEGVAKLAEVGVNVEAVWRAHAVRYTYDANQSRTSMTDQNGRRTLYYYNQDGQLTHSINALGEVQEISYNAFNEVRETKQYFMSIGSNNLAAMKGGLLNQDVRNVMAQLATTEDAVASMLYDKAGQVISQIDALGFQSKSVYNAFGEVKQSARQSELDPNKYIISDYRYDNRGNRQQTLPFGKENLANFIQYDAFGRVEFARDANQSVQTREYDRRGNLLKLKDPLTPSSSMVIDAFGRVSTITDSAGQTTIYAYDLQAHSMTVTTPEGVKKTTVRNRNGDTVSITDNEKNVTTYEYRRNGQLKSISDSQGLRQFNEYDNAGLLINSTDANGVVTHFEYDAANRVLKKTLAYGTSEAQSTSFAYSGQGRILTVTDTRNVVTETVYYKNGQVKSITVDPTGLNLVTSFKYDSRGNKTLVIDPNGNQTTFSQSEAGYGASSTMDVNGANLRVQTWADGVSDGQNIILRVTGPAGKEQSTRYAYDDNHRLQFEVDPEGAVTGYGYDDAGRLVKVSKYANKSSLINPNTVWSTSFGASAIGASFKADDARDVVTRTVYDKDGRVWANIDAMGYVTINEKFDGEGRVCLKTTYAKPIGINSIGMKSRPEDVLAAMVAAGVTATDSARQAVVYDARGNARWIMTAVNSPADGNSQWSVTEQTYDGNRNPLTRIEYANFLTSKNPLADVAAWAANSNNQNSVDNRTRLVYDAANRVVATAQRISSLANGTSTWSVVAQQYDQNGNLIQRTEFNKSMSLAANVAISDSLITAFANEPLNASLQDKRTRYVFDSANRATLVAQASGVDSNNKLQWSASRMTYDAAGNLVASTRYANALSEVGLAAKPNAQDISNWFAAQIVPDATRDEVSRRVYDGANRLQLSVDALGAVSEQRYDAQGKVSASIRYAKPIALNGLALAAKAKDIRDRLTLDASQDQVTRNVYDANGNLRFSADAMGFIQQFKYDTFGRVSKSLSYPSAKTFTDDADFANRVATTVQQMEAGVDANSIVTQVYMYDAAGQVSSVLKQIKLDANGKAQWAVVSQSYDGRGNLIAKNSYSRVMDGAKLLDAANPSATEVASWVAANGDPMDSKQRYVYDSKNQQIATASAIGMDEAGKRLWSLVSQEFDANGNLLNRHSFSTSMSAVEADAEQILSFVKNTYNMRLGTDVRQHFAYDANHQVILIANALAKDVNGNLQWSVTKQSFDALGNLQSRIQYANMLRNDTVPSGANNTAFDAFMNAVNPDSPLNKVERFVYDAAQRVVLSVDAANAATRRVYDSFGNVVQTTSYANLVTNAANGLSLLDTPAESAWDRINRTVFDRNNRAVFSIDSLLYVSENRYDAFGNVVANIRYANSVSANIPSKSPEETRTWLVPDAARDHLQRQFYDLDGRVAYSVNAHGYIQKNVYNAQGRVVEISNYALAMATYDSTRTIDLKNECDRQAIENSAAIRKQVFSFDLQGNLLSSSGASNQSESFTYDALGNKTSFTDKRQFVKDYEYDAAGRVVRETGPAVSVNSGSAAMGADGKWSLTLAQPKNLRIKTLFEYDAFGNLISRTEAEGEPNARTTKFEYDAAGRQVKTIYPTVNIYDITENPLLNNDESLRKEVRASNLTVVVSYDAFGNAIANKDVAGKYSYKTYDVRGQLRWEVDAAGYVTSHVRNAFGEVVQVTRFEEQAVLSEAGLKDGAALLRWSVQANGQPRAGRILLKNYDRVGQLTGVIEPLAYAYDSGIVGGYAMLSKVTKTKYDAFGQAVKKSIFGADANGKTQTASQDTYFYFDRAGQQTGVATVIANENGQVSGYLTTMQYDQYGDLVTQIEYANAVTLDADALASKSYTLPKPDSVNDRETRITYDANHRKKTETQVNARYSTSGSNRQTLKGITTTFEYDALGNQVASVDALGNTTYQYFDAMGRVTAVANARGDGSGVIQLSEFKLDAYGNAVQRTDFALSALSANKTSYTAKSDSIDFNDRTTGNLYDINGHVIQTIDAENNSSFTSYDEFGRVAKQWQRVTNNSGVKQIAFKLTKYDVLGHVVDVVSPDVHYQPGQAANGLTHQLTEYNAFGEITAKKLLDSEHQAALTYAYYKYDNAGHLWRTNADDGIDKVNLYDAFGQSTAQIRATNSDLSQLNKASDVLALDDVLRTNTRYDLMGRVVNVTDIGRDRLETVQREADGSFSRKPLPASQSAADAWLLLGDASDSGSSISVTYRRQGETDWSDGSARVSKVGEFTIWNTAGLSTGDYEYKVQVQTGSNSAVREIVKLHIDADTSGLLKQTRITQIYNLLHNRGLNGQEMNTWVNIANTGASFAVIARDIFIAAEAQNYLDPSRTGGMPKIVETIFREAFGRSASVDDLSYASDFQMWTQRLSAALDANQDNRGQVLLDMLDWAAQFDSNDSKQTQGLNARQIEIRSLSKARLFNRTQVVLSYAATWMGMDGKVIKTAFTNAVTDPAGAMNQVAVAGQREMQRNQLASLYVALFGRLIDYSGHTSWTTQLQNGATIEQIAKDLMTSPEANLLNVYPEKDANNQPIPLLQRNTNLIHKLYQNLLARPASPDELKIWLDRMSATPQLSAANVVLQMITFVATFAGSDSAVSQARNLLNNRVAVSLAYVDTGEHKELDQTALERTLFGSITSQGTIDDWVKTIQPSLQGAKNAANAASQAATNAAESMPLEEMRMQVSRLFVTFMNRAADADGMQFWIGALQRAGNNANGLSIVTNDFLKSDEAKKLFPETMTATDFITKIYQQNIGRAPAPSGLNMWLPKFDPQNRGALAAQLITAFQVWDLEANAVDRNALSLFNNKVAVSTAFALDLVGQSLDDSKAILSKVSATDMSVALAFGRQQAIAAASSAASKALDLSTILEPISAALLKSTREWLNANAALAQQPSSNPSVLAVAKVARLYVAILNRGQASGLALDLPGLTGFARDLLAGTSEAVIAQNMYKSDEGLKLYPLASFNAENFVRDFYSRVLGRSAGTTDVDAWKPLLKTANDRGMVASAILRAFVDEPIADNLSGKAAELNLRANFLSKVGSALGQIADKAANAKNESEQVKNLIATDITASAAVSGFSTSAANADVVRSAATLMVGILKRGPGGISLDIDGLNFWTLQIKNGVSPATIAQAMIRDFAEGINLFAGAITSRQFVNQIYRQVLGRELSAGDTFWETVLNNGASRGQVAVDIISSFLQSTPLDADEMGHKADFDNKLKEALKQAGNNASAAASKALTELNTARDQMSIASNNLTAKQNEFDAARLYSKENDPTVINAGNALSNANTANASAERVRLIQLSLAYGVSATWSSLSSQLVDLAAGRSTMESIAVSLGGSYPPNASAATRTAFVQNLYSTILGRSADTGGLNYWLGMTTPSASPGAVILGFLSAAVEELTGPYSKKPGFAALLNTSKTNFANAATNAVNAANQGLTNARNAYDTRLTTSSNNRDLARTQLDNAQFVHADKVAIESVAKVALNAIAANVDRQALLFNQDIAHRDLLQKAKTYLPTARRDSISNLVADLNAAISANAPNEVIAAAVGLDIGVTAAQVNKAKADAALTTALNGVSGASSLAQKELQLLEIYTALLNRAPSAQEIAADNRSIERGMSMQEVVAAVLKKNATLYPASLSNLAFVSKLYEQALGRRFTDDPGGITAWSKVLEGPTAITRPQLVLDIVASLTVRGITSDSSLFDDKLVNNLVTLKNALIAEKAAPAIDQFIAGNINQARADAVLLDQDNANKAKGANEQAALQISRLFLTIFGRAPDASGLTYWSEKMTQQNVSAADLAQQMVSSEEGRALFGPGVNFVDKIFRQALGRSPTSAEQQKYIEPSDASARGQLALRMINDIVNDVSTDLSAQTTQAAFNARVVNGLKYVAWSAGQVANNLGAALPVTQSMVNAKPINFHLDSRAASIEAKTKSVDRIGTNKLTLDRWGNVLSISDARNPNWLTTYTYNTNNQQTSVKKPNGASASDLSQVSNTTEYDALGRVVAVRDGNSFDQTNALAYNKANLTRYEGMNVIETHADGGEVLSVFNLFGERTSVQQPAMQDAQQTRVQTNYAYDHLGHLVKTWKAAAVEVWDANDLRGIDSGYDMRARLVETKKLEEKFVYDELGRRIVSIDGAGKETKQDYDLDNNLIRVTSLLNKDENVDFDKRDINTITRFGFDSMHRKLWTVDANGNSMSWAYNDKGQLSSHIDMGNVSTLYTYDNAGQQIKQTSSLGQNLVQRYENGLLVEINDLAIKQKTSYRYDLVGNRVEEKIEFTGTGNDIRPPDVASDNIMQLNRMKYDAQNRLTEVIDSNRFQMNYVYDSNSNRLRVTTKVTRDGQTKIQDAYHTYDEMNRQLVVNGDLVNGKVVYGKNGHLLAYDQAGNRVSDTYIGTIATVVTDNNNWKTYKAVTGETTERFTYDAIGRLSTTTKDNFLVTDVRKYDAASRTVVSGVADGFEGTLTDNLFPNQKKEVYITRTRNLLSLLGISYERRISSYYRGGQLRRQTSTAAGYGVNSDVYFVRERYDDHRGYDAVGNVLGYEDTKEKLVRWTSYQTEFFVGGKSTHSFDSYQDVKQTTKATISWAKFGYAGLTEGEANVALSYYDVNGNRIKVTDKVEKQAVKERSNLWYDSQGHVLIRKEGDVKTYNLIVNGNVLGAEDWNLKNYLGSTYQQASAIAAAAPAVYSVQRNGETLRSIAQAVWGDSSLWYMIADANGIDESLSLSAGRILQIPIRINTQHNDASTYKPYNLSEAVGDVSPTPPPTKPDNCGPLGQIIMIVVAVVVTIYTAGAMSGTFATLAQTMSAGVTALGGGAAVGGTAIGFTGAFIAGAAGSLVSQVVGIGMGMQDGINWKGVALSGIGSAVGMGVNSTFNSAAAVKAGGFLSGSGFTATVGRALISNVATQAIGVATHMQDSFSWRNVAASGAAAGMGNLVGGFLGKHNVFGSLGEGAGFAREFTTNMFSGAASAAVRKGAFNLGNVAVDAFGNALGSSIVDSFTKDARQIFARAERMISHAQELDVKLSPIEAQRLAAQEMEFSKHPEKFTSERQLKHVDEVMAAHGASESDRSEMARRVRIAQAPPVQAANELQLATQSGEQVVQRVEIVGSRGEQSLFGQFLKKWQDPLAAGGRLGAAVGEFLEAHKWATYTLTAVEAITSPAIFAGRELFNATPLGKSFNEKLASVSESLLDTGSEYVNKEGRIGDKKKSSEIVGGLMLGASLVVGGVQLFKTLAPKIGQYFGKMFKKVMNDIDFGGPRGVGGVITRDVDEAGSAKSATHGVRFADVLRAQEQASPLIDSLRSSGKLPPNYLTKAQAEALGWEPGKALGNFGHDVQLGGHVFENADKILPSAKGRIWYEADIGLNNMMSRSKQPGTRLVYSNDGLAVVTTDHYNTFHPMTPWKEE